jgi:S1-C subfamily serine protease
MSVADMQGYMKALSAFEKGDEVTVTFLRNGKEGTAQLTF